MLATSPPASRRRLALLGAAFLVATTALSTARVRPAAAQSPPATPKAEIPTRTIPGVVGDADGNPVPGATVVVGVRGEKALQSQVMTTDAEGRFSCKLPMQKSWLVVFAYKAGSVALNWNFFFEDQGLIKEVKLQAPTNPPASFVGELKDVDGRPLAGATVRVDRTMFARQEPVPDAPPGQKTFVSIYHDAPTDLIQKSPLESLFRTTTDKDGRFTLTSFPAGIGLKLIVLGADGRYYRIRDRNAPDPGLQIPVPPPSPPPGIAPPARVIPQGFDPIENMMALQGFVKSAGDWPVDLIARPAARIEGQIVSSIPGLSLGSLTVCYQQNYHKNKHNESRNAWGETVSSPDGRFAFDDLDEGIVNVLLGRANPEVPRDWTFRAVQDVRLVSGETSRVEVEIIRGVEVEGVVRSPEGAPVADLQIGAHGPAYLRSGSAVESTKTDERGRYRFRLPPGGNDIYVMNSGMGGNMTIDVPDGAERFKAPDLVVRDLPIDLKRYPRGDFLLNRRKP